MNEYIKGQEDLKQALHNAVEVFIDLTNEVAIAIEKDDIQLEDITNLFHDAIEEMKDTKQKAIEAYKDWKYEDLETWDEGDSL